jgi:PAS domain S-box-containing protein
MHTDESIAQRDAQPSGRRTPSVTSASKAHRRAPREVAPILVEHALVSDRAILVGNRAGVVEWANPAWTRITGFPLESTVSKPISHFLGEAEIELELELVDFVGQAFLEGRRCTIEFPFETFDARSIWVHLEVQPIRNAQGEIAEFVATATDETERRTRELEPAAGGESDPDPRAKAARGTGHEPQRARSVLNGDRLRLSNEIEPLCRQLSSRMGTRTDLDVCLDPDLPVLESNRRLLVELASRLLDAACMAIEDQWGCVTVLSGRTRAGRSHASAAHPIPARPVELARQEWAYLEIHDTSTWVEAVDVRSPQAASADSDSRLGSYTLAAELARVVGGSLHLDSTPGCGNQALLLLPLDD